MLTNLQSSLAQTIPITQKIAINFMVNGLKRLRTTAHRLIPALNEPSVFKTCLF